MASGTQETTGEITFNWRKACFSELGFSEHEADALAMSKELSTTVAKGGKKLEWETPLHWSRVKFALDNGCTHAQALEIFVTVETVTA